MSNFTFFDFDLYAQEINLVVNGRRKIPSITGMGLSLVVTGIFFLLIIQYLIFTATKNFREVIVKNTPLSKMTRKVSLLNMLSNSVGLKTNNGLDSINVLLSSNFQNIENFDINQIFTENSYSNFDTFILTFSITNRTDNSILSLNNGIINLRIQVDQILFNRTYNLLRYEKDIEKDLVYSKKVISSEIIKNYSVVKCVDLFQSIKNYTSSSSFSYNSGSILSKYPDFNNFEDSISKYPIMASLDCLTDFSVNLTKTLKPDLPQDNYIDYNLSFNFDLCFSELDKNCLYDYKTVYEKINSISIKAIVLERKMINNKLRYFPRYKDFQLNMDFLKNLKLNYDPNYFYEVPMKILAGSTISPFFSCLFFSSLEISHQYVNRTQLPLLVQQKNKLDMQNLINSLSLLKIDVNINDIAYQNLLLDQKIIYDVGILFNTIFFVYSIGRFFYFLIEKNKRLKEIIKKIMILVNPSDSYNFELEGKNLRKANKKLDKNKIIVKQNEYLKYQELTSRDKLLSRNERRNHGKSTVALLEDRNRSLMNVEQQIQMFSKLKNNFTSKKKEKSDKMALEELEISLKEYEEILFQQINFYISFSNFDFNNKSSDQYHYEKQEIINKSFDLYYQFSNISNIAQSVNLFKLISVRILFQEYQYYLIKYLSPQIIVGDFILGFPSINYMSDNERIIFQEKFRRALKKFRKNGKFRKLDKKFIKKYSAFTQQDLIANFISLLKNYFNIIPKLDKIDV